MKKTPVQFTSNKFFFLENIPFPFFIGRSPFFGRFLLFLFHPIVVIWIRSRTRSALGFVVLRIWKSVFFILGFVFFRFENSFGRHFEYLEDLETLGVKKWLRNQWLRVRWREKKWLSKFFAVFGWEFWGAEFGGKFKIRAADWLLDFFLKTNNKTMAESFKIKTNRIFIFFPEKSFQFLTILSNIERSKIDWWYGFVIQSSYITIGWRLVYRGIYRGKSKILWNYQRSGFKNNVEMS